MLLNVKVYVFSLWTQKDRDKNAAITVERKALVTHTAVKPARMKQEAKAIVLSFAYGYFQERTQVRSRPKRSGISGISSPPAKDPHAQTGYKG